MSEIEREAPKDRGRAITSLLRGLPGDSKGRASALNELIQLVHGELRQLAQSQLGRFKPGDTLQATVLINEAYLKIFGKQTPTFEDRRHFFGAAARAMRNIIIDTLRAHRRRRDRVAWQSITSVDPVDGRTLPRAELLALDDALDELKSDDPQQHEIVLLRFFAGLQIDEVAELLEVSPSTVDRQWRFARASLHRKLKSDSDLDPPDQSEGR